MDHHKWVVGWDLVWYPGGDRYRAAYAANYATNNDGVNITDIMEWIARMKNYSALISVELFVTNIKSQKLLC